MSIKEKARFYIDTPEKAGEALLFAKNLSNIIKEIDTSVRERASKVMDDKNISLLEYEIVDPNTGEIKNWEIRKQEATELKEYRAENFIQALGENAIQFLTVSKTKADNYLKKASAKNEISMQQVEQATSNPIIKLKKGSIVVRELKPKQ